MSKLFRNQYGLNVNQLKELHDMYEVNCTAEYIMDNYDINEDKAIKLGYEVREKMNKYGYSEDEAIDIIMSNLD